LPRHADHPLEFRGRTYRNIRVIASEAKQSRLAARDCFGALRAPRNDSGEVVAAAKSAAYAVSIAFMRIAMAQEPLATKGNYLHIYDFRVMKGKEDEFIRLFEEFDYSDGNPMHKSRAQVKDGVLCRDTEDPQRFFLIAEWSDIEEHARIRKILANELKPEFIKYIEGGKFIPKYVEVVLSTPDEILQKAAAG
jgi:hypothetical protein